MKLSHRLIVLAVSAGTPAEWLQDFLAIAAGLAAAGVTALLLL
jgi:hypothetical protein